jgi:hypothetical protein
MPLPICHQPDSVANLQAFLARWPLEKVRAMKLEEYTKARAGDDDESFKASFCYALEQTTPVGIGGSSAIKFAIYARANLEKDPGVRKALFDKLYCWKEDLGKTSSEVFAKVRELIVDIVEASQAGDYDRVERNPLSRMLKWKIAFLYQNPSKPGIVGCLNEGNIRDYFDEDDKPIVQLHAQAMERFKDSPSLQEIGLQIWNETSERVKEPKNDESAESDDAALGRRGFWNFSYGQDDADGINDLETLLSSGQIRGDWPTGMSLEGISADKKQGKLDALDLLAEDTDDDDATESGRRPTFNFFHMGIPKGAVLTYVDDPSKTVKVLDERQVEFQGVSSSMTDVTRQLKGLTRPLAPLPHWTFKGERLSKFYDRTYPTRKPTRLALMCWLFAKKMRSGDVVFARQSGTHLYIAGMVTSDYQFDGSRDNYEHVRDVRWLTTAPVDVPEASRIITQALTDITTWEAEVADLCRRLGIDITNLPEVPTPSPSAHSKGPTSMNKPTNVILYGPPGTGKTFHTKEHAVTLCNGKANPGTLKDDFAKLVADKRVAFVTFHQSYDYSDFIIGFKPVPSASGMSFEVRKGVLMRLAEEAEKNPQLPYLLIIDEINRGNISKIFGELITLIEADKRRDGDFPIEVTLPCAFKGADGRETCQFSLPSNIHLLGTMNTADRSIALLDTALRRRFKFERKDPQPDLLHADLGGVKLRKLLTKLNEILADAFSPDHQIGHAWMPMKFDSKATGDDLIAAFNDKILPLLDEWYYDNIDAKKELLGQLTEDGDVTLPALKKFAES